MKKKKYREIYHVKNTKEIKKKKINNNIAEDPVEIANNTPDNNKIFAFKNFLDKNKKSDE